MAEYDNEISKEFLEYAKALYIIDELSENQFNQLKLSYFVGASFGIRAIFNGFKDKDPFEALSYTNNLKKEISQFIEKMKKELKNVQNK